MTKRSERKAASILATGTGITLLLIDHYAPPDLPKWPLACGLVFVWGCILFAFFDWALKASNPVATKIGRFILIVAVATVSVLFLGAYLWHSNKPQQGSPPNAKEIAAEVVKQMPRPAEKTNNVVQLAPEQIKTSDSVSVKVKRSSEPRTADREESGLGFKEVDPTKFGLKRESPDYFLVDFGSNISRVSPRSLKQQFPFESIAGMSLGGEMPLKIWLDQSERLRVDAVVYSGTNKAAIIKNNEFALVRMGCDRNWDDDAFEIVDENLNPLFQVERTGYNRLRLRGEFVTSEGKAIVSADEGVMSAPFAGGKKPVPHRIFEYPSKRNLHLRIKRP